MKLTTLNIAWEERGPREVTIKSFFILFHFHASKYKTKEVNLYSYKHSNKNLLIVSDRKAVCKNNEKSYR